MMESNEETYEGLKSLLDVMRDALKADNGSIYLKDVNRSKDMSASIKNLSKSLSSARGLIIKEEESHFLGVNGWLIAEFFEAEVEDVSSMIESIEHSDLLSIECLPNGKISIGMKFQGIANRFGGRDE